MAGVMGLAPTSSTVTGWILVSSNSRPANWQLLLFDLGMVGRQGLAP